MKELGWFFTFLGSGGFIGTMVAKDSQRYKLDNLAGYLGLSEGYKSMIDILFYLSIVIFIFGLIMLLVGYFGKNTDNSSSSAFNNYSDFSQKTNSNDFPNPSGKTINDLYKKG